MSRSGTILAETMTDAGLTVSRHARLIAGLFVFLVAALGLSLWSDGELRTGARSGAVTTGKTSQDLSLAARDTGRAVFSAERREPPPGGGYDPGAMTPVGLPSPTVMSRPPVHGPAAFPKQARFVLFYGFLPRGPPVAIC